MEQFGLIPRRFHANRVMQLKWVSSEFGGRLIPVIWTRRFLCMWGIAFLVFAGFGATWGWLAARSGHAETGVAGFIFCVGIWGAILGIGVRRVSAGSRGGAVCELDRQAGVIRMPREGIVVPLSDVRLVRSISFSLERSSNGRQVVGANQLLLLTESGAVHVATQFMPESAAERLARAIGVEFSACGAERQDLTLWERAPVWDGEIGTRH